MFDFKNMFSFKKLFFLVTLISFFPTVGESSEHQKEIINNIKENVTTTTNYNEFIFPNNDSKNQEFIEKILKNINNNKN